MAILDDIKLFKGITDDSQDKLLELIISDSTERILAEVNLHTDKSLESLPDSISYIVRDVAIKRYNKLNSEGAKADSEEGRSFTWEDSYLDEYKEILANLQVKRQAKGIARFF